MKNLIDLAKKSNIPSVLSTSDDKELAKIFSSVKQDENIRNFLNIIRDDSGKIKSTKVDVDKVAKYIEDKFDIRTIFGIKEETIEIYDDGIWIVKGKGKIQAEIERLLNIWCTNTVVREILEKIKRRTEISREETDDIPWFKRCVANGVLDLNDCNNITFLKHDKRYNFRSKFPMVYNPKAKCEKIENFLKETFYEEDILTVQEWIGLHLVRRYLFKKAALFHGPKNTGKTVFLNLMTTFLGGNISGLSLQEISNGKAFDLLALKDKDGNICDDLSSADMKQVGGFKKATGDGFIDGEMKFGDKCRFRNTAKDTNSCNQIPNPGKDIDDEAYYERMLLIPVDNTVPKEKQNKQLIDELTSSEELSGMLNWAIEGYKRLVKNNQFTNEKTPEETKFLMLQNGNSLAEFSNTTLVQEDGSRVTKEQLYNSYCNWCRNHKPQLSPDSKEKIGRSLTKFAPYAQATSNGSKRYWLNVRIKSLDETYGEDTKSDLLGKK